MIIVSDYKDDQTREEQEKMMMKEDHDGMLQ